MLKLNQGAALTHHIRELHGHMQSDLAYQTPSALAILSATKGCKSNYGIQYPKVSLAANINYVLKD